MYKKEFNTLSTLEKQKYILSFIKLMPEFTDEALTRIYNCSKLWLWQRSVKATEADDSGDSDDGDVYHMKPFNNNDFIKHSHKDDERASKPVTMPRIHHHSNGANATEPSPKASHLRTSIKKSIQKGIKHNGFHQSLKGHNLMTDTLNNTRNLKWKKSPHDNPWHQFTDKDLIKFFRHHH